MEDTVERFAKVLGAGEVHISGRDVRFAVHGPEGGRLRVSFEGTQQRFMGVLTDAGGVTRCTIDLAPVNRITEPREFPGRVTLHAGTCCVHIDSRPTIAIEIETRVDGAG